MSIPSSLSSSAMQLDLVQIANKRKCDSEPVSSAQKLERITPSEKPDTGPYWTTAIKYIQIDQQIKVVRHTLFEVMFKTIRDEYKVIFGKHFHAFVEGSDNWVVYSERTLKDCPKEQIEEVTEMLVDRKGMEFTNDDLVNEIISKIATTDGLYFYTYCDMDYIAAVKEGKIFPGCFKPAKAEQPLFNLIKNFGVFEGVKVLFNEEQTQLAFSLDGESFTHCDVKGRPTLDQNSLIETVRKNAHTLSSSTLLFQLIIQEEILVEAFEEYLLSIEPFKVHAAVTYCLYINIVDRIPSQKLFNRLVEYFSTISPEWPPELLINSTISSEKKIELALRSKLYSCAVDLLKDPSISLKKSDELIALFISCLNYSSFKEASFEKTLQVLDQLIKKGQNPDQLYSKAFDASKKTVLEHCILYEGKYKTQVRLIADKLLEAGAKIPLTLANWLFLQRKSWSPILAQAVSDQKIISNGLLQAAEISPDMATIGQRLLSSIVRLREYLRVLNISEEFISYLEILKLNRFKKELKMAQLDQKFQETIQEFHFLYGQFMERHSLMVQLRKMRRETRSGELSSETKAFFGLLHQPPILKKVDIDLASPVLIALDTRKIFWRTFYQRALSLAEEVRMSPALRDPLAWMHGTGHKNLPSILWSDALLAQGHLLQTTFPLDGELFHPGDNQQLLSGSRFSRAWPSDQDPTYFQAISSGSVSLIYSAQHENRIFNSFNKEEAWGRVNSYIQSELHDPEQARYFKIDVCRLNIIERADHPEIAKIKVWLQEHPTDPHKEILDLINKHRPNQYTEEDILWMTQKPFGVIFASHDVISKAEIQKGFVVERRTPSPVELSDMSVVFTPAEYLVALRSRFKGKKVTVFSDDVFCFLEFRSMLEGSRIKHEDPFMHLVQIMRDVVLPLYSQPFPAVTTYWDQGRKIKIPFRDQPDYSVYVDKVLKGEQIARPVHGRLHAARTALWTLLLSGCSKEGVAPYAYFGGMHDCGRKDDGIDYWDARSARLAVRHALKAGFDLSLDETNACFRALANKDPEDGVYDTRIQQCVHNADVFEILRCLENDQEFDPKHLSGISEEEYFHIFPEIRLLIRFTEKYQAFYELEDPNCFESIVYLMLNAHNVYKCFPWCVGKLKPFISELPARTIDLSAFRMFLIGEGYLKVS